MAEDAPAPDALPPLALRIVLFGVACGSVIPLLAWVYDLGPFRGWAIGAALPSLIFLIAFAAWLDRSGRWVATRAAITAGAIGGLLGTFGYDLFRVPFVFLGGMQLLAPIDSYGVLLLGVDTSSGLTGLAGWGYHFLNGIGFGVAYAVVARGKHWGWGVLWGMVLETAVVVSPFATDYALRTDAGYKVVPILLAYLAHIPYGFAVGKAAQRADAVHRRARESVRTPVAWLGIVGVAGLLLWQWPLTPTDLERAGNEVAEGPSAVIVGDRQYPAWIRVAVNECATIANDDPDEHTVTAVVIPAGGEMQLCDRAAGIHRLQVDDTPFSGGWLIVDDQAP